MLNITARELARLFSVELERDHWGDIDPCLFKQIAEDVPEREQDDPDSVLELKKLLGLVADSLNSAQMDHWRTPKG